ncbi:MAG: FAD-binding protein, partial [Gemmatimonadetes bacterium]|nr:FAD-binding protein [Gemmatimonadota bacterium]
HYTMGGLWVDYNLMTSLPGLYAIGEVNFSDHGANRLGASALMQGLADGYFVLPLTIGDYIARHEFGDIPDDHPDVRRTEDEVRDRVAKLVGLDGSRTVDSIHRELGRLLWEKCGMSRNAGGLKEALDRIPELREEFWNNAKVVGSDRDINEGLEKAGRVADFFDLGELMCRDALAREESCGGHLREEHQTPEGEAQRDDERFTHVTVWEYTGPDSEAREHRESLSFTEVAPSQRSYK